MLGEILSAYQGVKAAKEIVGGINALNTEVEVKTKTIELLNLLQDITEKLLQARADAAALHERKAELEQALLKLQDWQAEKRNYRLCRTEAEGLVYRYQAPPDSRDQLEHDICVGCYDKGVKSILQPTAPVDAYRRLKCHVCNSEVLARRTPMTVEVFQTESKWRDY